MWNKLSKEETREILLSAREQSEAAVRRILTEAGVEEPLEEGDVALAGPFDPVIAALEAEMPELIAGKRKKDVEEEDELDDEEEEEDELDEEEDEDDFDDEEEDEDDFEEEFGDDELDDDDDDIFYDDDDDE